MIRAKWSQSEEIKRAKWAHMSDSGETVMATVRSWRNRKITRIDVGPT